MNRRILPTSLTSSALALVLCGAGQAGETGKTTATEPLPEMDTTWCDVFGMNTLLETEGLIRSVKFKGRYHGQWISQSEEVRGDSGTETNGYHGYGHRRFRLGTEIEFAHDLTFLGTFNIADGTGGSHGLTRGVFLDDTNDFVLQWKPSDDFYLNLGKKKQPILREYSTSSKRILTIERSAISNTVVSNQPWGLSFGFETGALHHELGGWMTGVDRDATGEHWDWPDFDSRGTISYVASLDLNEVTTFHFDYLFTNNHGGMAGPQDSVDRDLGSPFEHVVAFGTESRSGKLSVDTDLILAANGVSAGGFPAGYDTWGVVLMPWYDLTEKLQLVTRYAYMDQGQEQRPQRFDVRQSVEGYLTLYAGMNYYLCGHNLKLMAGYEYALGEVAHSGGDEIRTGSWMLAVRTYW